MRALAGIGTILAFVGIWLAWATLKTAAPQAEFDDAAIYMVQLAEQQAYVQRLILSAIILTAGVLCWIGACIVAAINGKP